MGTGTSVRMRTSLYKGVNRCSFGVIWLHSPETLVRDFLVPNLDFALQVDDQFTSATSIALNRLALALNVWFGGG